jgi:hypothetical protein
MEVSPNNSRLRKTKIIYTQILQSLSKLSEWFLSSGLCFLIRHPSDKSLLLPQPFLFKSCKNTEFGSVFIQSLMEFTYRVNLPFYMATQITKTKEETMKEKIKLRIGLALYIEHKASVEHHFCNSQDAASTCIPRKFWRQERFLERLCHAKISFLNDPPYFLECFLVLPTRVCGIKSLLFVNSCSHCYYLEYLSLIMTIALLDSLLSPCLF